MTDQPKARLTSCVVLDMTHAVSIVTDHFQHDHRRYYAGERDTVFDHPRAGYQDSEQLIDWCIERAFQETLLFQIEGHRHHGPPGFDSFYHRIRYQLDPFVFSFHPVCISDKLNNPCLPLIYVRKGNSVYLICPEI